MNRVVLTRTAHESLWPIYLYHHGYAPDYADDFQFRIDRFMVETLSANPLIGRLYHAPRNIRRLVFQSRYSIYYVVRDNTVYVLFVFDGRMAINTEIETDGLDVDGLID